MKKIIITSIFLSLVILAGCSSGEVISSEEEVTSCAQEGEKIGASSMPSVCCEGLSAMGGFGGGYQGDCNAFPPGTGLQICSVCGDGFCDTYNIENKCNCPDDCTGEELHCVDYFQEITDLSRQACCLDYKPIKITYYDDDCSTSVNMAVRYKCMKCGDGICDQGTYLENKCNCPEDCQ